MKNNSLIFVHVYKFGHSSFLPGSPALGFLPGRKAFFSISSNVDLLGINSPSFICLKMY